MNNVKFIKLFQGGLEKGKGKTSQASKGDKEAEDCNPNPPLVMGKENHISLVLALEVEKPHLAFPRNVRRKSRERKKYSSNKVIPFHFET